MPIIKNILVFHEEGMESLIPHVVGALNDVMDCFPQYKQFFPIFNMGNWASNNAIEYRNGQQFLMPYESIKWYIERAKLRAMQEGRWQSRRQINVEQIMSDLSNDPYFFKLPQWGIYLTKNDLYGGSASNYCLGITQPNAFSIISSRRFWDKNNNFHLNDFLTVVQHEFGHIIRLTEGNHPNIKFSLGPHCKDQECIMQQRENGDFSDITRSRLLRKAHRLLPICKDCMAQGQRALFKIYAANLIGCAPNIPGPCGPSGGRG